MKRRKPEGKKVQKVQTRRPTQKRRPARLKRRHSGSLRGLKGRHSGSLRRLKRKEVEMQRKLKIGQRSRLRRLKETNAKGVTRFDLPHFQLSGVAYTYSCACQDMRCVDPDPSHFANKLSCMRC